MLPEETFELATSFHLLLLDVRSVIMSPELPDAEKVKILSRHVVGPYRASLIRSLITARRQFTLHKTPYADAVGVADALNSLLSDSYVLLCSSGEHAAIVRGLRDLVGSERWDAVHEAYATLVSKQPRKRA